MSEEQHADWNPLDAATLKDQRRAYDETRERCPVAYSEFMGWSLFRHEDIAAVLADPEAYSNVSKFLAIPNGMDPPLHGKCRAALDPNFDPEHMASIESSARDIAADLMAPLLSGEAEFIEAFVNPFALKTLCAMLGWPAQQWKFLNEWVNDSQQAAFDKDPVAGKTLADRFAEHVKANLDQRRASPDRKADATDALMRTEIDGVPLDDEQIVSVLRNWTAGHGTVAAGLGIVVMHLARDAGLQDRLRRDPALVPAAIEEILRVDGPLVANPRTTTREVSIQGRSIPAGAHLTLMWIAANRDPHLFEKPNDINIERNMEDSLVWGQGIHVCQGAPLARLELRAAVVELLSRTQHFELANSAIPRRAVHPGNGLAALSLRLG